MTISKQKAEEVAKKMTQPKQDELIKLSKEMNLFIKEIYLKKIPKEVMEMFAKERCYFSTISQPYSSIEGLGSYYPNLGEHLPTIGKCFVVTGEDAEKYVKMHNDVDSRQKALNRLKEDISMAIFQFRTYKNLLANFPEAAKHMDASNGNINLPVVKLDKIREALNS